MMNFVLLNKVRELCGQRAQHEAFGPPKPQSMTFKSRAITKVASMVALALLIGTAFAVPLSTSAKSRDTNEQVQFVGLVSTVRCKGNGITNCTNKIVTKSPDDLSTLEGKLIETKMENRLWFCWVSKANDDGKTVQAMVTVYPLNDSQKASDLQKSTLKGYLGQSVTVQFNNAGGTA